MSFYKCFDWFEKLRLFSYRMVVKFTTTCAIVAYHHLCCEFEPHAWRGVLDKTLCDKRFSVTCYRWRLWFSLCYVYNSSHNYIGNNIVVVLLVLVKICHIMTQRDFMLYTTIHTQTFDPSFLSPWSQNYASVFTAS
jgi:hypothetical protein